MKCDFEDEYLGYDPDNAQWQGEDITHEPESRSSPFPDFSDRPGEHPGQVTPVTPGSDLGHFLTSGKHGNS